MTMADFTGQTYGEATRQRASQRVVRPGPPPTQPGALPAGPTGAMPEMMPFDRPTEFPEGMPGSPMGDMPPIGIEPGSKQDLVFKMRAMVSKYPNSTLITLLEHLESM
jgi:hypothetical protein